MNIDKSKLGNIEYGKNIAKQLKKQYVNKKIIDIKYNYLAEGFVIILDNKKSLFIDL